MTTIKSKQANMLRESKMYNIIIEYYRNNRDVEAGNPCRVVESGFVPMTLKEAQTCKSKMSDHPVCGMIRINKIVEV